MPQSDVDRRLYGSVWTPRRRLNCMTIVGFARTTLGWSYKIQDCHGKIVLVSHRKLIDNWKPARQKMLAAEKCDGP